MFYEDNLIDIPNHQINNLHEVNIKPNTHLYKIIKKDKILANSRHNEALTNTNYIISATSTDNIIKTLDYPNINSF